MSWESSSDPQESGLDVAIVGMAGRFPGAPDLDAFWRNLREGVESISFFSDEELEAMGVDPALLSNPSYVKAGAVLDDIDLFDAAFFGYSPREARILDPQHRIFLECAWEALENAGCDPERHGGIVGVYAGTSLSSYLLFNLLPNPEFVNVEDNFQVMVGNDKDFLATRVSYNLNLDGPSIDVQTGCSTSLVALHLASQGLLSYHLDVALAGGVSVHVPQRTGYTYQPGGITSPDGHCRVFDARAEGTIFGSGVGVVVLKRLADALADRDSIRAVIKGSAVNNDGSVKVGYTAPGLEGQTRVIKMAQAMAGIDVETIRYVEAHGTGTGLGDPVEVAALTRAFRAQTERRGFCAIGSVKSNIGHTDAAAGVAGLIKTVLALENEELPPSLHFEEPNPRLELEDSPFVVNGSLTAWSRSGAPRRAGVSSFGIGGTNAHVIVEEAPSPPPSGPVRRSHLLLLSAKTGSALEEATANLTAFLDGRPEQDLADVAHTLAVGRRVLSRRRICVCRDREEAVAALESLDPRRVLTLASDAKDRPVVFMFPGGGAQYIGMARDLYETEVGFREPMDACAELLRRHGIELLDGLYPASGEEAVSEAMESPSGGLPPLFAVEYALAKLWMSWGVRPKAMIGHSLGEYAAACLAGVFQLDTALELVVTRARLFEELPDGGMLGVPLPADEVESLLTGELSLAAINGPAQCVVSGPKAVLAELADRLLQSGTECRAVKIDVAAHSHSVDGIVDRFREVVETVDLEAPSLPYLSNVTGTWITAEEATDPAYWARHLRQTVRFGDGVRELLGEPSRIFVEVGPGQVLSTLVRAHPDRRAESAVFSSVRHPHDPQSDDAFLLTTLGRLWLAGVEIDWKGFSAGERRRVALPTYPFERRRYWVDPLPGAAGQRHNLDKKANIDEWFYVPSWRRTAAPLLRSGEPSAAGRGRWLVLRDRRPRGLGRDSVDRLRKLGAEVVEVLPGTELSRKAAGRYTVRPDSAADLRELLEELRSASQAPSVVAHLWSLTGAAGRTPGYAAFEEAQERGLYSLLALAQALAGVDAENQVELLVVSDHLEVVESADVAQPEKATMLGACRVIPQEVPRIDCRLIDAGSPLPEGSELAERLLAEVARASPDRTIAYRGGERWAACFEPVALGGCEANRPLRKGGVYLVLGGLGGVGSRIAGHLAQRAEARLVLAGRTQLPPRDTWEGLVAAGDSDDEGGDAVIEKIRRLQALESLAGELLVERADIADPDQMTALCGRIERRFGRLDGVIHAAGIAGETALTFLADVDRAACARHFDSKVKGLYVLGQVLAGRDLDFCLLCSSNASILGGLGSAPYAAANCFMDAFVLQRRRSGEVAWISANWDGWLAEEQQGLSASFRTSIDRYAMSPEESVEAFERVVTRFPAGQVAVSTGDLAARIDLWIRGQGLDWDEGPPDADPQAMSPRTGVDTPYVAPSNDLEKTIARIWQKALGIEQVGVHDNFFDLGGNSLIGLKVISRLRDELEAEIQVVNLFEGPTVSALAQLLGQGPVESYDESRHRGERRKSARRERRRASQR